MKTLIIIGLVVSVIAGIVMYMVTPSLGYEWTSLTSTIYHVFELILFIGIGTTIYGTFAKDKD